MYYCYILLSLKSHIFYYGSTKNLKTRIKFHNDGNVKSTKPHLPWKLVWYGAFETEKQSKNFEEYLKSGSGKAFAYKRLVSVALANDITMGRKKQTKDLN
ncbi:MAG: GIY-YIG nuclease family protein [Candidatus Scalindua sp.]|nr:GIY-YIG nuclease family protein [Candidatus Scalindua sp.]